MPTKTTPRVAAAGKRLPKGKRGGIELLLVHTVEHLGKQGEVVEVKRGYAINYLLPQGLATIATDHHKRMVEKHRAKLEEIARERLAGLRSVFGRTGSDERHHRGQRQRRGPSLRLGRARPEISRSLKQQDLTVAADQIILQGPLEGGRALHREGAAGSRGRGRPEGLGGAVPAARAARSSRRLVRQTDGRC